MRYFIERGKGGCVLNKLENKIRAAEKAGGKQQQRGEMAAIKSYGSAAGLRKDPSLSA